MSFTIEIGKTSSPRNKINKTFKSVFSLEGSLKDSCSILQPVIQFRQTEGMTAQNFAKCNYMYIEKFGRYYYITDVVSVRNSIVEVHGRVDVLYTYADEILANKGLLLRASQKANYSKYLDDGTLKIYAPPKVVTKKFNGSSFASNPSFVLAVSGS